MVLAFRVLYEDDFLVAVDKPANFHTHPPEDLSIRISPKWNGLRILEKQFQQKLYPAHRLDRATSGVLVLSRKRELNHALQSQFSDRKVHKQYAFLARGELQAPLTIDSPLASGSAERLDAS